MNIFATIKPIEDFTFKKVKYYSILFENNETTEFIDFLNRMEENESIADDLEKLFVCMEEIGQKYGAREHFFRHEGSAEGLPSPSKTLKRVLKIQVEQNLRLYCQRLNEHVVLLFNGDIKTEGVAKAQDCPNVAPYFKQANKLANAINQLFIDNEIKWNDNATDIIYDENMEVEI